MFMGSLKESLAYGPMGGSHRMRYLIGQMLSGHLPASKPAGRNTAFLGEDGYKTSPEVNSLALNYHILSFLFLWGTGIKSLALLACLSSVPQGQQLGGGSLEEQCAQNS